MYAWLKDWMLQGQHVKINFNLKTLFPIIHHALRCSGFHSSPTQKPLFSSDNHRQIYQIKLSTVVLLINDRGS